MARPILFAEALSGPASLARSRPPLVKGGLDQKSQSGGPAGYVVFETI